jgi:hypothetical protein
MAINALASSSRLSAYHLALVFPLTSTGEFYNTFISAYIDYFRSFRVYKKAGYSVQGVYVVVNNLPLPLRNLHENMMLACVMPGPNEPSRFEFNQILEPVVDELIALGRGKCFKNTSSFIDFC